MRSTSLTIIASTVCLVLQSIPVCADAVVAEFKTGSGQKEVGFIAAPDDALSLGPAAVAVENGIGYLLDRVKQRLIKFGTSSASFDEIGTVSEDAVDVAVDNGRVWIFIPEAGAT